MRKRLLMVLVVVAVLGVLMTLRYVLLPPSPGINWVSYDRIKVGMRQAEVEALLGGPPGDYYTRPILKEVVSIEGDEAFPGSHRVWLGDEGGVIVGVDKGGCIRWKAFLEVTKVPQNFSELLMWRLRRLWLRIQLFWGK